MMLKNSNINRRFNYINNSQINVKDINKLFMPNINNNRYQKKLIISL